MRRGRVSLQWAVALASVLSLAGGLSAERLGQGSQGVVTPDNPLFGQDTPPVPDTPPAPETPAAPAAAPAAQAGRGGGGGRGSGPRPYNQVITNQATTDAGIFKVHRVGETVYFEIPKAQLGKDFLWVTQLKRTTVGAGYGGQAVDDRVVRWEQAPNNRILLKLINYDIVADPSKPIAQAVADANNPTILRTFNVAAVSPIGDPVIDVTALLLAEVAEFSPRQNLGARGFDPSRTYLEKIVSFPENINVQVTQTYTAPADATGVGRGRAGMRGNSGTVVLFHSIVKLPEKPMMARLSDSRVGYFTTSMFDYGRDEHKSVERDLITRYRLEKKDPTAALSEPVKPIVYYVDPATPSEYVPWIKKAIEDWNPAFEGAGFKNAIVAKEAPSKSEDPDWDPEDVRYSVIRWLPSTTENASGPHIADPRSGEILEGDIQLYHNVQNLATMWYFTQVGALDPRAQKLPLPNDLMGRLMEFMVAHEIGHTLGLRHNMKASSLYTIEQIRDKNWVKENSHTPTIMDYARFNYVAQPEDGIAVDDLVPKLGPYDKWAIKWGYAPVAGATTPDEERPALDRLAREQETKPYLRFTTSDEGEGNPYPFDPGQETEAVGDSDATRATELGLRNLRRVADLLVPATSKVTEPYDDLAEAYVRLLSQWRLEMSHVANVVGGIESRELYAGQPGLRFTPISRLRQAGAVQFLLANAFKPPTFLLKPDVLRRIEPSGAINRLRTAQASLINSLLQSTRIDRLVEQSVIDQGAYTPVQFLADLRSGLFSELGTPAVPIDIYRRNVQRLFIQAIDSRLNASATASEEVRALLKGELRTLDAQIARAQPSATDVATRRHLQDARDLIATALDPRAMRGAAGAAGGGRATGAAVASRNEPTAARAQGPSRFLRADEPYDFEHDPFLQAPVGCWPDLLQR